MDEGNETPNMYQEAKGRKDEIGKSGVPGESLRDALKRQKVGSVGVERQQIDVMPELESSQMKTERRMREFQEEQKRKREDFQAKRQAEKQQDRSGEVEGEEVIDAQWREATEEENTTSKNAAEAEQAKRTRIWGVINTAKALAGGALVMEALEGILEDLGLSPEDAASGVKMYERFVNRQKKASEQPKQKQVEDIPVEKEISPEFANFGEAYEYLRENWEHYDTLTEEENKMFKAALRMKQKGVRAISRHGRNKYGEGRGMFDHAKIEVRNLMRKLIEDDTYWAQVQGTSGMSRDDVVTRMAARLSTVSENTPEGEGEVVGIRDAWFEGVARQWRLAELRAEDERGLPGNRTARIKELEEEQRFLGWGSVSTPETLILIDQLANRAVEWRIQHDPSLQQWAQNEATRKPRRVDQIETKDVYRQRAAQWGLSVEDFDRWDQLDHVQASQELKKLINSLEVVAKPEQIESQIEIMMRYLAATAADKKGNGERNDQDQELTMIELLERQWKDRKLFLDFFGQFESVMKGSVAAGADGLKKTAEGTYGGKWGVERLTRLWRESWPVIRALEGDKEKIRRLLNSENYTSERQVLQEIADGLHIDISEVFQGYKVWRVMGRHALHDAWMDKEPTNGIYGYGRSDVWSGLRRATKEDEGLAIIMNYKRQAMKFNIGNRELRKPVDTHFRDLFSYMFDEDTLKQWGLVRNEYGIIEDLTMGGRVDLGNLIFKDKSRDFALISGWISAAKSAAETADMLGKWLGDPSDENTIALRDGGWKHLFIGPMGELKNTTFAPEMADLASNSTVAYVQALRRRVDGSCPPVGVYFASLGTIDRQTGKMKASRAYLKRWEVLYTTMERIKGVGVPENKYNEMKVVTNPQERLERAYKLFISPIANGDILELQQNMMRLAGYEPNNVNANRNRNTLLNLGGEIIRTALGGTGFDTKKK